MQAPEQFPEWRTGEVIDDRYRVVGVAGKGGMGIVYQVRHLQWGIDLAAKRPFRDASRSRDERQFVSEAEAWVNLGLHPNICGCHYVRRLDGLPTVFAEYVPDGNLHSWIASGRILRGLAPAEAVRRALDVAIQFAWGLEHAHRNRLVHQDVKPANVLIDTAGGDIIVKVTDFGLARARTGAPGPAAASLGDGRDAGDADSVLVGRAGLTREYASPEQLANRALSRRTDIYSYATSVLQVFTGRRTWPRGDEAGRALAEYLADGPGGRPGLPEMPAGLAALLGRCLERDPADRPGTMAEVAAELVEIHRSATGRPYPRPEPVPADLRADELNNRALSLLDLDRPAEADKLFVQALEADPRHPQSTYNAGMRRWRRGEISDESMLAELEGLGPETGPGGRQRHLLALVHMERGDVDAACASLAEHGDGPAEPEARAALQAIAAGEVVKAGCAATLPMPWQRWPERDRPGLPPMPPGRPLNHKEGALRATPDAGVIVAGHGSGSVIVWKSADQEKGRLFALSGHSGPVHDVDVTPDGRYALTAGFDGDVRLWDIPRERCVQVFEGTRVREERINQTAVRVSHDGSVGAWTASDGTVQVWDLRNSTLLAAVGEPEQNSVSLAMSPDGRRVVSSSAMYGTAWLWDVASGRCLRQFVAGQPFSMNALCLSADGRLMVSAGILDTTIRVWDLEQGRCVRVMRGHTEGVDNLALRSDSRFLLSGARDQTVRYWDLRTGRCVRTFRGHDGDVCDVRFVTLPDVPGGERFGLSLGKDHTLRFWELPGAYHASAQISRPRPQSDLNSTAQRVRTLVARAERAISDGRYSDALEGLTQARAEHGYERAPEVLASWRKLGRHTTRVGLRSVSQLRTLGTAEQNHVGLSADGRFAVTGDMAGVQVWDVATGARLEGRRLSGGKLLRNLAIRGTRVLMVQADIQKLMVNNGEMTSSELCLWQRDTGEIRRVGGDYAIRSLHWTADDDRILLGGYDGSLQLWDLAPAEPRRLHAMPGHSAEVSGLSSTPDGRTAASAGWDGTVRLWDLRTGQCVGTMGGNGRLMSVSLSSDGRFALCSTGRENAALRLWDTASGRCVRTFDPIPGGAADAHLTQDGRFAVSVDLAGSLRIWQTDSGHCIRVVEAHPAGASCAVLPAHDQFVLTTGGPTDTDGPKLWDLDWELASLP
ncbi:protein kinase [Streptomyces sp. TLI_105]|uniref:protein kinase domain-containing protein n=1 Tax=Streptomyces sp. TLI_105 TaxID=1881019 RepID=UPI0008949AD2|nr:protein kinase [Streptomyces sp. TLI_105]SEB78482.1 WD40 repeat [Streptomyces sp. TLI_105]